MPSQETGECFICKGGISLYMSMILESGAQQVNLQWMFWSGDMDFWPYSVFLGKPK